jgi:predicted HAD superfamily Cof-like phosphohydrolase
MHDLYSVALTYGIDLDTAITAVHLANMSKLGLDGKPILRADGKALKGPNYRMPDLTPALLRVGKYT